MRKDRRSQTPVFLSCVSRKPAYRLSKDLLQRREDGGRDFFSHLENGGEGLLPQRPGWPALPRWELASSSSWFKIPTLSPLLPAPSLNLSPASILLP